MKKLLLTFCLSVFLSASYGQEYFVLHVFGEIHNPKTNANLKTGDKLTATDNLKFMGQGAKAMVMSPSAGRFVLAPSVKNKKSEETGFLMTVKNAVLPPENVSYLSTRSIGGISTTENIMNFKDYFGTDVFSIIGDSLYLTPSLQKFDMENPDMLFVMSFTHSGQTEKAMVPKEGGKILFHKALFPAEGISDNYQLFTFNKATNETKKQNTFNLSFIDKAQLLLELNALAEMLRADGYDNAKTRTELHAYVGSTYGRYEKSQLDALIDKEVK